MNQFPFSSKQKVPFVCFGCRIGLKTTLFFYFGEYNGKPRPLWANPKCPQCKKTMVFVGRYLKTPSRNATAQWRKIEMLWQSGWMADGYSGGPKTPRDAREFVQQPSTESLRRVAKLRTQNEEQWRKLTLRRVRRRHTA